jgi:hypothetical protein
MLPPPESPVTQPHPFWYSSPVRHLRFLPLAYLIGVEGFVFFLPFLMLCLAIHLVLRSAAGSK